MQQSTIVRKQHDSEHQARDFVEAAREKTWSKPSFIREMYNGDFQFHRIHPYPLVNPADAERAKPFLDKLEKLLKRIDSDRYDREGDIPIEILDELKHMGAFGIKIPQQYGGLGLSLRTYVKAMGMVTSVDASLASILSAHQSIGLPQPLHLFGTEEQKKAYFPRLAAGAISSFALTEPGAGSDPSKLTTSAKLDQKGENYILNGEKLWIVNGSIAELLVVMARTGSKKITAFIVEANSPGVEILHRCRFIGLKAAQIGALRFTNVRIPRQNILGKEGEGLKLALTTLNTGRLALPYTVAFTAKRATSIIRRWVSERIQWGKPIGKHDAVAQRVAELATMSFVMESVADLVTALAEAGHSDIRLEAAMAKLYNSEKWGQLIDSVMQIKGGRGYETADSLRTRGEVPDPIERFYRDARGTRIYEGTSQILQLFIAREVVDNHIKVVGKLAQENATMLQKLQSLLRATKYYVHWYPRLWIPENKSKYKRQYGQLSSEIYYLHRCAKRLARTLFHTMIRYGTGLEKRQTVLARMVDIGGEMFAMAATCSRAQAIELHGTTDKHAVTLARLFCSQSQRRVELLFKGIFANDDAANYKMAQDVINGNYLWLESGLPLDKS